MKGIKSYIDQANEPRRSNEPERFRFGVGEHQLVLMTLVFLTSNRNATHKLRSKILEFLEQLDEALYSDTQDIVWRIALARSVGQAVLRDSARTIPAVEARVLEDTEWADYHAAFFETYKADTGHAAEGYVVGNELSDEDLKYIDGFVSTRLRFSYLWSSRNFLREVVDRIDADDMGEIGIFNDRVMSVFERLVQKGRAGRALSAYETQDFATGDRSFEAAIRTVHAVRNMPQSKVSTGIGLLNEMLGGGYEGGRVYVHFGRSGDWKSGMLCSLAFWACDPRFNPSYETKDPTRRPCVLFLTMENDLYDTIERMVSFGLGSNVELKGSNVEEIISRMEQAFSTETCRFVFKYRPSRSISTGDMESMIQDLYLEGYEVIMIVQDYIKRIRPMESFKEARHLELGAVVDDFSGIAKRHSIPIVTGMQFNRGAYEKFEAAIMKGDLDAVKRLGASDAGESINVYENADCVIFQGRVVSEAIGRSFLTMRRGKMRGRRPSNVEFCAQPFDVDENGDVNEMRLSEDAHLPKKEWRGRKELIDAVSKDYDADAPGGACGHADQPTREERKTSRSAAVLSPRRRGKAKVAIPENAGDAVLVHEEDDGGMDGL